MFKISISFLKGTPRNHLPMNEIVEKARNEAHTYKKAGIVSTHFKKSVLLKKTG